MYCWGEVKLQECNILDKKDKCCHTSDAVQMVVPAAAISDLSIGERVTAILRENGSASVAVRLNSQKGATWKKSKWRQRVYGGVKGITQTKVVYPTINLKV